MAYAIDTLVKAGGDDAHYRLLGAIQTLAESAGWTTLRFDTASSERELILRSTGTTGEEQITVGFKAYQNVAADYYNLLAATMVGYVPAAPFEAQPGIKTSGVPGHHPSRCRAPRA